MTSEQSARLLEGVYVANVTPFLDDDRYSIDARVYEAHVRWLADHGVTGIVPFGTNGEGPSIAAREKRPLFEALAAAAENLQIIATVAEANLPDTLDQLTFLDDLPVRAVMVMPPYYFKPVEAEGLKIFYERVLEATRHPLVLYHIPKYAIPIPTDLVISLPVWGVKDSGGEAGYADTLHAAGKGVLVGTEDDLPGRLPTADGCISALANIVPEQVVSLYSHIRAGRTEEAAKLSDHLLRVRAMTKEYASPGILKRVAEERHGHPMGTVRPPLVPISPSFDVVAATALALSGPEG
ncbi:MAG TPA: dihydrodipicolinate synthase family protein [Propionibacteriaceae bacterium]|nr:dihydrodipicolinate synthase family protein [Propionibacteriaceae bacterium]